MVPP
jgi:hypothetical protein